MKRRVRKDASTGKGFDDWGEMVHLLTRWTLMAIDITCFCRYAVVVR
jgi:hypothetical protein